MCKTKCHGLVVATQNFSILDLGGGAMQTQLITVQKLQDQASKLALDRQHHNLSPRQRQQLLGWLSIDQEITRVTHTQTYKILTTGKPQEIATQMPKNEKNLRIQAHHKLGTKPHWLGTNRTTRSSYRNRAYTYNTLPINLTAQTDFKKFKKDLKNYLKYR